VREEIEAAKAREAIKLAAPIIVERVSDVASSLH